MTMRTESPFGNQHYYDAENLVEKSAEEKAIDEWIPISSSSSNSKGKWWFSAFHNVTAMVGAGVLSFPYSMAKLGWGPGVTVLVMSWIVTLYTLWQMVEMHEVVPGKRFDRYHELGQHAFGEKLGLWIVVPLQLIVEVGVNIVYMILGGRSLMKFHDLIQIKHDITLIQFIMIFASVQFVLSQLPNFHSIYGVSLAAAIMSLSYSTIAWGASVKEGTQHDAQQQHCENKSTADTVFHFFSALGNIAFGYAGHNIVLEIQSTMPSTPHKPSKGPMWKGVIVAYIIVALCYFPVAIIGYWAFGETVKDNILVSLEKPKWLIATANMFVVIHLFGGYQIYAMPVFDMVETVLVRKLRLKPSWYLRFLARNTYVAFTMFVAVTLPFFDELLGFFGGFAFAPTTYFLPCIIWLVLKRPRRFSVSWFTNWICIILGVGLMVVASIGGLRGIIIKAQCFKFYSDSKNQTNCCPLVLNHTKCCPLA